MARLLQKSLRIGKTVSLHLHCTRNPARNHRNYGLILVICPFHQWHPLYIHCILFHGLCSPGRSQRKYGSINMFHNLCSSHHSRCNILLFLYRFTKWKQRGPQNHWIYGYFMALLLFIIHDHRSICGQRVWLVQIQSI